MNRKDSGCEERIFPQSPNKETTTTQKICTTSTSGHSLDKPTATSVTSHQLSQMEQRRSIESRSRPSKRTSTTSSSENSGTRSKGRSKPSSHRTSCTIVDPSRPARHYRVKSTHTVPAANGHDIDDVLALHFRSCSLFTNPSYQSNSRLPSPTGSPADASGVSSPASPFTSDIAAISEQTFTQKEGEETIRAVEKMNTTMHWTSPSTRQREYERIDRANSGLRGLFRKVAPRCVSGPSEKFYEKDQSDTGSVRRYRLDDVDNTANEKEMLRSQTFATSNNSMVQSEPTKTKKRWLCF